MAQFIISLPNKSYSAVTLNKLCCLKKLFMHVQMQVALCHCPVLYVMHWKPLWRCKVNDTRTRRHILVIAELTYKCTGYDVHTRPGESLPLLQAPCGD